MKVGDGSPGGDGRPRHLPGQAVLRPPGPSLAQRGWRSPGQRSHLVLLRISDLMTGYSFFLGGMPIWHVNVPGSGTESALQQ